MKRHIKLVLVSILISAFVLTGCRVDITATYDVVIFGSGPSSIALALNLDAASKRVLIVEPSGIIGGNKRLISDGVSYLNQSAGDTIEKFTSDMKDNNGSTNFFTTSMIARSVDIPAWLGHYNIQLDKTIKLPGHQLARTNVSEKGVHTGKEVVMKLDEALRMSHVELSYNSNITRIAGEPNNMYHLTVEQKNSVISLNAKNVVFAEDQEVAYDAVSPIRNTESYKDVDFAGQLPSSDGMELLQALHADYSNAGNLNIIDTYNMASARPVSPILRSYGAMLVNQSGKRFVNEMANMPTIIDAILKQEEQTAYLIYDDVIDQQLFFLNDYYQDNTFFKSPSITVMARNLQMDEDALRASISKYHKMIKSNDDTDFKRSFDIDKQTFAAIAGGTTSYYAIKVRPVTSVFTSYAEVTDRFEVMRNGEVLPGIYAIGDSAKDVKLNAMLPGTELTLEITMGLVASDNILNYLEKLDNESER